MKTKRTFRIYTTPTTFSESKEYSLLDQQAEARRLSSIVEQKELCDERSRYLIPAEFCVRVAVR